VLAPSGGVVAGFVGVGLLVGVEDGGDAAGVDIDVDLGPGVGVLAVETTRKSKVVEGRSAAQQSF
jgi:hypothetical protein